MRSLFSACEGALMAWSLRNSWTINRWTHTVFLVSYSWPVFRLFRRSRLQTRVVKKFLLQHFATCGLLWTTTSRVVFPARTFTSTTSLRVCFRSQDLPETFVHKNMVLNCLLYWVVASLWRPSTFCPSNYFVTFNFVRQLSPVKSRKFKCQNVPYHKAFFKWFFFSFCNSLVCTVCLSFVVQLTNIQRALY